jgi:hypothetical protein
MRTSSAPTLQICEPSIGRLMGETAARARSGLHDARLAWARELADVLDSPRMREAAVCRTPPSDSACPNLGEAMNRVEGG